MYELQHCGTQVIETERLILRPYTVSDAEDMYQNWASSDEVTRYLTWPIHTDSAATRKLLELWVVDYQNPAVYHWGITVKGSNTVIGDISVVHMNEKTAAAELGWCIGQAWWGQGIMPEAALAVRDYLFDRVGFHRVEARHDKTIPNPAASCRKSVCSTKAPAGQPISTIRESATSFRMPSSGRIGADCERWYETDASNDRQLNGESASR